MHVYPLVCPHGRYFYHHDLNGQRVCTCLSSVGQPLANHLHDEHRRDVPLDGAHHAHHHGDRHHHVHAHLLRDGIGNVCGHQSFALYLLSLSPLAQCSYHFGYVLDQILPSVSPHTPI